MIFIEYSLGTIKKNNAYKTINILLYNITILSINKHLII